jgi:hypothetical protein
LNSAAAGRASFGAVTGPSVSKPRYRRTKGFSPPKYMIRKDKVQMQEDLADWRTKVGCLASDLQFFPRLGFKAVPPLVGSM